MATEDPFQKLDKLLVCRSFHRSMKLLILYHSKFFFIESSELQSSGILSDGWIRIIAFHVNETNNMTFLPGKQILWLGR